MIKAIDLFAGAGGFTEGARLTGVSVIWAANHNPLAVQTHSANHPETTHICQDLHQADWSAVPAHDFLLASPCCQGHAKARGKDRPHHDASRSTAWAVISALEFHRPAIAIVENVREFLSWSLYPAWRLAAEALGYCLTPFLSDAADHGVPQHRVRLFIALSRSRKPLRIFLPKRPHQPISSILDWAHPMTLIATPRRSSATLARIRAGRGAHGDRFVMPYYGSGSGLTGRSIHRPLGTVTTLDRWGVVSGDKMRMMTVSEYRAAMGFRDTYILPRQRRQAIYQLGNAVSPTQAADVINAVRQAAGF